MGFVLRRSLLSITGLLALVLAVGVAFVVVLGAPLWFPAIFAVAIVGIQYLINPRIIEWLVPATVIDHDGTRYLTDHPIGALVARRCADAGIPLGNQTVLLRGVNSSVRVLRNLFTELLRCRVRPYYLFQGDVAAGTSHLRTSVETGVALMQELRGHISGLAIPHLVIDTPGGMGKVSIGPDYVVARGPDKWTLRNYEGKLVDYPQPADKDATCAYDEVYFGR